MRFLLVLLSGALAWAQPPRPYNPFNQLCLPNMVVAGPPTGVASNFPTCRFLVPGDIGGVSFSFIGTPRQITLTVSGATTTFSIPADLLLSGQSANGTDMLSGSRFTDASPTGNFMNFKSLAGASLWQVDVTGTLQIGSVPTTRLTGNVSNSQLATMANQTFKGNISGGTAAPSDLTVAQVNTALGDELQANKDQANGYAGLTAGALLKAAEFPAFTGDVTTGAGSVATAIAAAAVTLSKMANLPAFTIIGNNTGSPTVPAALTAAMVTAMLNTPTISGTPSVGNCASWVSATQVKDVGFPCSVTLPFLVSTQYNFPAQTPGISLTGGIGGTVNLTPPPPGVNATDTNHYLYISAGTGTPEATKITGGTCSPSSVGSCSVTLTPVNSHTGAWTIQSATSGIQEAIIFANGVTGVVMPGGSFNTFAPIYWNAAAKPLRLIGSAGIDDTLTGNGTLIHAQGTGDVFQITSNDGSEIYLGHFGILGQQTGGNGITCTGCNGVQIDHVKINGCGGHGMTCTSCLFPMILDSSFVASGLSGLSLNNSNNVKIVGSTFSVNVRGASNFAGISASNGQGLSITASDFENNGMSPFGGVTITGAYGILLNNFLGVSLLGNYLENNLTANTYLSAGVSGFSVNANFFDDSSLVVDTANNGTVSNNVFRNFNNPTLNVSSVVDSSGNCLITTSANHNLTVAAMVIVSGIGGATVCNGPSVVLVVPSLTSFITARGPGTGFTSGGTVIRASGWRATNGAGSTGNITAFGNDLTTSGVTSFNIPLLDGVGPSIASAATIVPASKTQHVTGTAAIATIAVTTGANPQFCALPDGAFTTTNAGNIAIASTAVVGKQLCFTYDSGVSKWYPSY